MIHNWRNLISQLHVPIYNFKQTRAGRDCPIAITSIIIIIGGSLINNAFFENSKVRICNKQDTAFPMDPRLSIGSSPCYNNR